LRPPGSHWDRQYRLSFNPPISGRAIATPSARILVLQAFQVKFWQTCLKPLFSCITNTPLVITRVVKVALTQGFRLWQTSQGFEPRFGLPKNHGGLPLDQGRFGNYHFSHTIYTKKWRDDASVPPYCEGLTHFCWVRTCATFEEHTRRMQLFIHIHISK